MPSGADRRESIGKTEKERGKGRMIFIQLQDIESGRKYFVNLTYMAFQQAESSASEFAWMATSIQGSIAILIDHAQMQKVYQALTEPVE
jgi:hypothetical protein